MSMNPEAAWNLGVMEGQMQNLQLFGNRSNADTSYYENEIHYANQVIGEHNVTIQLQELELTRRNAHIAELEAKLKAAVSVAKADHALMDLEISKEKLKAVGIKEKVIAAKEEAIAIEKELHDYKFSSYRYAMDYDALLLAVQAEYGPEIVASLEDKRMDFIDKAETGTSFEDYPLHEQRYAHLYRDSAQQDSGAADKDSAQTIDSASNEVASQTAEATLADFDWSAMVDEILSAKA